MTHRVPSRYSQAQSSHSAQLLGGDSCGSVGNISLRCLCPSAPWIGRSNMCAHMHGFLNTCAYVCLAHATRPLCAHFRLTYLHACDMHVCVRACTYPRMCSRGHRQRLPTWVRLQACRARVFGRAGVQAWVHATCTVRAAARAWMCPQLLLRLRHVSNETVPLLPCSLIKHTAC